VKEARAYLLQERGRQAVEIVRRAKGFARVLGILQDWQPLDARQRQRLLRLLGEARPLIEEFAPPERLQPIDEMIAELKRRLKRGRPKDDCALFAKNVQKWFRDRGPRPLNATELLAAAVAGGVQAAPLRGLVRKWIALHKRHRPQPKKRVAIVDSTKPKRPAALGTNK